MKLDYDKNELLNVLADFYTVTNASVSVFDCDFRELSSCGRMPDYCKELRRYGVLHEACMKSDREYADKCASLRKGVTYTCHAGLLETIYPIRFQGILLGYVIFGGVRDAEGEVSGQEKVEAFCAENGLDAEKFLGMYGRLTTVNRRQLTAYVNILEACVKNVLVSNVLKLDSSVLSSKIVSFLQENFTENFSVDELCKRFFLSEKTLYKIVKESTGVTVNGYVTGLRMQKARELLESTDVSVTEVASETGYYDYNYFIRVFRKSFGISPLQYRKRYLRERGHARGSEEGDGEEEGR